jgi:hypothetical protein
VEELKIGKPATGEIVIYLARNMRGGHRHIFTEEPDLRHPEDAAFNDAVSSFVILKGVWKFYRDVNYMNAYDDEFGPGVYDWVESYGIRNDEMSSLKCIRP